MVENKINIKDMTLIALFVAVISVSAQVAIPLGMVPFTLQTMCILLAGLILGGKKGTIAILIYILVGAVGMPVFANFKGGIGTIFMQTGGFIMSFPIMAYCAGKIAEMTDKFMYKMLGCLLGVTLNFVFGCTYFMIVTKMDLMVSLSYTVFPFIATSLIQIILAIKLSEKINSIKTMI